MKLTTAFWHAIEWRVIATSITFLAVFAVSRNIKIAMGATLLEATVKIVVNTLWLKYWVSK